MSTCDEAIGLVVRQRPYAQRSPRAQLDVALASAALDQSLEVYFLGEAIEQLSGSKRPERAGLPRGLKGWAALPDLVELRCFADGEAKLLRDHGDLELSLAVEFLSDEALSGRLSKCRHLIAV